MSLSTSDKYNQQAGEACERLGIDDTGIFSSKLDDRLVLNLGWYTGENITLAKAINDISHNVRVILYFSHKGYQGYVELDKNSIKPAEISKKEVYTHHQNEGQNTTETGNAHNMQKYCGDKFLTNFILARNGIPVPQQKRVSIEKPYPEFGKDYVIKSRSGCGGDGVKLFRGSEIFQIDIISEGNLIIEELIESYPIIIEGVRKDWNLRVLVTFDVKTQRYITAGIVGRIDSEGGPVNLSLSEENISFENLGELCGWTKKEYLEIEAEVKRTAEISCEILVQAGNRIQTEVTCTNFQTIFGVDIIIDTNKKPKVIEVNDSDSGCIYELAQLHGIKSIYPIAKSIINKAILLKIVADLLNLFIEKLTEEQWSIFIKGLYSGKLKTYEEDGKIKIRMPREFLGGLELLNNSI